MTGFANCWTRIKDILDQYCRLARIGWEMEFGLRGGVWQKWLLLKKVLGLEWRC